MKKIFMGSIALTAFSISILVFQMSCQKEATAQSGSNYTLPPATTTTLGGIIVGNGLSVTSNGTLSVIAGGMPQQNKILFLKTFVSGQNEWSEIWTANYDGTNAQKINIAVPTGMVINLEQQPVISPDRQTIFFSTINTTTGADYIYSCKLDGTNVTKIVDGTGTSGLTVGAAF